MNYLLPVVFATLLLSAFMFAFMKNAVFAELRERAGRGRSGRGDGAE